MNYIVFDLDQTLLNDKSEVTDYTLAVLSKLRALGHKIVINTARSRLLNQAYFEKIQPDFAILCGGAGILDKNGTYVYQKEIPKEKVKAIAEELSSLGRPFSIQADTYIYSNNPDFKRFDVIPFNPDSFDYSFNSPKLIVKLEAGEDLYFREKYDLDVVPYFNGPLYRFNHRDATKAKGNAALVKLLGGSIDDVIAFGDDVGDIDMLKEAGIGVIMKNATDSVKAQFKYITEYTNDEDGVARFLEKHFGLDTAN